jgi:hypothetical protein
VTVDADAALFAALAAHQEEIAECVATTRALKGPIIKLAGEVAGALKARAATDAGVGCVATTLASISKAEANIHVCLDAAVSVMGTGEY